MAHCVSNSNEIKNRNIETLSSTSPEKIEKRPKNAIRPSQSKENRLNSAVILI